MIKLTSFSDYKNDGIYVILPDYVIYEDNIPLSGVLHYKGLYYCAYIRDRYVKNKYDGKKPFYLVDARTEIIDYLRIDGYSVLEITEDEMLKLWGIPMMLKELSK